MISLFGVDFWIGTYILLKRYSYKVEEIKEGRLHINSHLRIAKNPEIHKFIVRINTGDNIFDTVYTKVTVIVNIKEGMITPVEIAFTDKVVHKDSFGNPTSVTYNLKVSPLEPIPISEFDKKYKMKLYDITNN